MTLVYIAIGSNITSPLKQINSALNALRNIPYSRVVAVSSCYNTLPIGPKNQPDYLNAVVAMETSLLPEDLFYKTRLIEFQQHRIRKIEKWGPRTIDLDIILFGNKTIQTDQLIIPHYDMRNRDFMLWPLFEIAPKLRFPDGETLEKAVARVNNKNIISIRNLLY